MLSSKNKPNSLKTTKSLRLSDFAGLEKQSQSTRRRWEVLNPVRSPYWVLRRIKTQNVKLEKQSQLSRAEFCETNPIASTMSILVCKAHP